MNDNTYIILLDILEKCRNELINEYSGKSTDLSYAFYDSNIKISNKYIKLFKLKWIQSHLNHIKERIVDKKLIFSLFAKFYEKFIDSYRGDISCFCLDKQIDVLRKIISSNKDLDTNIKKVEILFLRDLKLLEDEIKNIEDEKNKKG